MLLCGPKFSDTTADSCGQNKPVMATMVMIINAATQRFSKLIFYNFNSNPKNNGVKV
jgi:hypothetical protein